MTQAVLLSVLLSTAFALLVARPAIRLCRMTGWVDRPDARKQHDGHVPIAGGLTVAIATTLAALAVGAPGGPLAPFWLGAALVFVIGFLDDRSPIRPRYRFAVQLFAALVFVAGSGVSIDRLGELVGPQPLTLGAAAVPFAVVGIAGLTNAVNMIDGVDGLAGSTVLVALLWVLCALALVAGDVARADASPDSVAALATLPALLVGALLGFLAFNLRTPWRARAAMFLGDGGSMSLGFLLAALLVYASGGFGAHGMPPVTALWIAGIPLFDIAAAILRRDLAGAKPMAPDRRHLHHLLLVLGLSPARAVALLQAVGLVLGLVGVLGWRTGIPDYAMFWGLVALFAACFAASQRAWARLAQGAAPAEEPTGSPALRPPRP
jgi:UDP-GlcNAc:undecaprenyl-phosphate GlcNAc-1-phosphate transferase